MSKRKQTENLHLYAYELTTGLPTFLKDWSDNMAILDSTHSAVLSLINALDGRLTTAEGLIEDLSPESIEDYKIRLNALEKKVVINTNGIKDVNTKIATVNAQINNINSEQIVQNNRLTAIETLGANHTQLINALRTDLTGVDGRVTTLEQCCENVQHEIADMQNDIDGFNNDVTALATQVETLSTAVTELTELVNSLQLDVVSQRLDSFEASLTELTSRVATAESNIVAHGATLEEHNTRITANENNIENIDSEIGDTDYSEIGDTVSNSLVELANRIRALTPQEYDVLVSRLNTVETEVGDIESAVDNLDSSVSALQTNVASKADNSDLLLVQGDVNALKTSVASKADSSDLTALSTLVGNSLDVTDPTEGAGVIKFGVDADGNYGYKKVGADTVTPFKTSGSDDLSYTYYKPSKSFSMYEHSLSSLYKRDISPKTYEEFILSNSMGCKKGNILIITVISTVRAYMSITFNTSSDNSDFTLLNKYALDIGGTGSASDPTISSISYIFKINNDVNLNSVFIKNTSSSYAMYIYGRISTTGYIQVMLIE